MAKDLYKVSRIEPWNAICSSYSTDIISSYSTDISASYYTKRSLNRYPKSNIDSATELHLETGRYFKRGTPERATNLNTSREINRNANHDAQCLGSDIELNNPNNDSQCLGTSRKLSRDANDGTHYIATVRANRDATNNIPSPMHVHSRWLWSYSFLYTEDTLSFCPTSYVCHTTNCTLSYTR